MAYGQIAENEATIYIIHVFQEVYKINKYHFHGLKGMGLAAQAATKQTSETPEKDTCQDSYKNVFLYAAYYITKKGEWCNTEKLSKTFSFVR